MQKTCDLCGQDVSALPSPHAHRIIDGKMRKGSWAWMCVPCHKLDGLGLGTGKGQLYDTLTGRKLEG